MPTIEEIRYAQTRAAEDLVCANLPAALKPETARTADLLTVYKMLVTGCVELELMLADGSGLTPKDTKRLDKSVTVIKVGFKVIKKVLRARGVTGSLKHDDAPVGGAA